MVMWPVSSGSRRASKAARGNSGNSSRNRTPWCASEISPGRGGEPLSITIIYETFALRFLKADALIHYWLMRLATRFSMTDREITIIDVTESEKGVRKIPRSYRSVTGRAQASGETVPYESTLERDFAYLADFDSEVDTIISQPLCIRYRVGNGRLRRYTVDFLLKFRSEDGRGRRRPGLYEIKYREELRDRWSELEFGFRAARQLCRSRGWSFRVVTERQIRGPYLDNVTFLRGFRTYDDKAGLGLRLLETLEELQVTTPGVLLAAAFQDFENRAMAVGVMWRLLTMGYIGVNLAFPLNMASEIWFEEVLIDDSDTN